MAGSVAAKSAHVSDASVQPFLQDDFDPADYLNNTLPNLSTAPTSRSNQAGKSVTLPELSTQLQTLLSQLNTQTSRLSTALTNLTDEIIRSGGRLAYEVELLRGETLTLTDSLENDLRNDIETFVPPHTDNEESTTEKEGTTDPEYLTNLKTLVLVRERLDAVIKTFDAAMQWPLAPSDVSLTSSLISVSAPDPSGEDSRSREEKAKAYTEGLKKEINDLIGSGNDMAALEAAEARVEGLRQLAEVWKGTAEEKARLKVVESLSKPVEEKMRSLEQKGQVRKTTADGQRGVDMRYGVEGAKAVGEGGYGFLQNLRRLGNDVYLE